MFTRDSFSFAIPFPLRLIKTPHLKTSLHSYYQISSRYLYCPGLRPPRGGTSLEKFLTLLHPLDDHLTGHVACLNRTVRSHQQLQVNQAGGYSIFRGFFGPTVLCTALLKKMAEFRTFVIQDLILLKSFCSPKYVPPIISER